MLSKLAKTFLCLQELLKINQMNISTFWISWFINGIALNIISIIFIVCFLRIKLWGVQFAPIEYCNSFILGLFLILYCGASITLLFVITIMFNKRMCNPSATVSFRLYTCHHFSDRCYGCWYTFVDNFIFGLQRNFSDHRLVAFEYQIDFITHTKYCTALWF